MSEQSTEGALRRLVDMVVEEVSLVDRAANQRTFLVVKRDETMSEPADSTTQTTDTEGVLQPSVVDEPSVSEGPSCDGPLSVALVALESLTQAVEMMGEASPEEAPGRLGEMARDLRTLADQLAQAAGGGKPEPSPDQSMAASFEQTITQVRTLLGRVQTLVASTTQTQEPKAPEPPPPQPDTKVAEQVAGVLSVLRTLTDALTAQNQRLIKLEKSFGVPNSNASSERPQQARLDAQVGWPLDMNRPFGRENVDKATSFHSPRKDS